MLQDAIFVLIKGINVVYLREVEGAVEVQVWQGEHWVVGEEGVLVPVPVMHKLLAPDCPKE